MRRVFRQNWRFTAVVAVTAALVVPLLVLGGPALAQSGGAASSQYEYPPTKVTICHRTHSKKHPWVQITISSDALAAHQAHGDVLPPCPASNTKKHAVKHAAKKHAVKHAVRHHKR